mgnify:CR=1 FL=1
MQFCHFNKKSVCVRVNGKPVKHKLTQNKKNPQQYLVLIGSVAGPRSKLGLSYCAKNAKCPHSCKVPKDEFMAAIGGEADTFANNVEVAQWDPSGAPSEVEVKLTKELKGLKTELEGGVGNTKKAVFRGWLREDQTPACYQTSKLKTSSSFAVHY